MDGPSASTYTDTGLANAVDARTGAAIWTKNAAADTGMKTLDNQKIFAAWDSTLNSLIGYIEGTDPNDAANQVFKMTVTDPLTGAYTFELLQPVEADQPENRLNDGFVDREGQVVERQQ